MILLNANLAHGAHCVSSVVTTMFINNREIVVAIYAEVSPALDALQTVLEAPGLVEHDYWHENVGGVSLAEGPRQDGERRDSSKSTGSAGRCKDQEKVMYNAFRLQSLTFPLTCCLSSLQIPPYSSLGRRERDEPGFMHLVFFLWLATLMRNRDRSDNGMILHRDVHMAAKMAALDYPPQVCSLQLTKSKRMDW